MIDRVTLNGFVKAKTGWIKPATSRWDNSEEHKTALFEIRDFKTFIKVVFAIIMDDCGSINLFCFEENRKNDLVNYLTDTNRPNLHNILSNQDLFITMFPNLSEKMKSQKMSQHSHNSIE